VRNRSLPGEPAATSDSLSPKADPYVLPRWRWVLLAWAVPAVISAVQTSLAFTLRPTRGIRVMMASGSPDAALDFAQWMSWALVTPMIFALVRRLPFRRGQPWRLAVHVAAALLTAFVLESIWYAIRLPFRLRFDSMRWTLPALRQLYPMIVVGRLMTSAVIYGAVVGAASALTYQRRLHDRELRGAVIEAELSAARLQTLKMQLHPHFLFNTLHAVTVLIRDQPAAAIRMVAQLGDLLRLSLARVERVEVTFREELDLVQLYFDIETIRFRDRLQIAYEIEPVTLTALVPDLLLQPLAENAIRHGVSRMKGQAHVRVRAARVGSTLVVEVHDTGRGPVEGDAVRESVGLGSTRRRLETLYGVEHALTLERSASEGGCVARVRIPFRTARPGDAVADGTDDTGLTTIHV
jgi:two-component system, LytTR family, sensor kinase